jgi:hypothetical protein
MLLVALITSATIGMALASYLKLVQAQNESVVRSQTWNSAMPVCEAGIEEALTQLNVVGTNSRAANGWVTGSDGSFYVRRKFGGGRYAVQITADKQPTITAVAYVNGIVQTGEVSRAVAVTTTRVSTGMKGMVAKGGITISGIVQSDSFDSSDPTFSTNGRYDAAKRKDNGYLGSVTGNLDLGNGTVYGSVATGPAGSAANGTVGDIAWVGNNSGIETGHYANDLNLAFPDVQAPFNGGGLTPQSGTVIVTNSTSIASTTNSTTLPNPLPSGIVTNYGSVTTSTYPTGFGGPVQTNGIPTSSQTFPAAGTYLGNVVTRTVTGGARASRGTWYDYNRITSYTYTTTSYSWSTSLGTVTTTTNSYDYVLDTGNYQLASLTMSGQSGMVVRGDAVLYIPGDMTMDGQAQITILPGASLTVYVGGAASLTGNGIMNMNADATKFSYYGLPSNTSIKLAGNAAFTGTIYAPSADLTLGGGGNDNYDCVGATITKSVSMNGHFGFHYDEMLGRVGGKPRYNVASWNEILTNASWNVLLQ